jgi:hypothetical protein
LSDDIEKGLYLPKGRTPRTLLLEMGSDFQSPGNLVQRVLEGEGALL